MSKPLNPTTPPQSAPAGKQRIEMAFFNSVQPVFEGLAQKNAKELGQVLINTLTNDPGPRRVSKLQSKEDYQLANLFRKYLEIHKSMEAIQDSPRHLKNTPPKALEIPLSRHLYYHVTNYLNEVYVLKLRLTSYWKSIIRTYNTISPKDNIDTTKKIDILIKPLDSIIDIRGKHVHKARFEDPELERLILIETLRNFSGGTIANALSPEARKTARNKWLNIMKNNEISILQIINLYCDLIYPVLFDPEGTWKSP